MMRPHLRAFMPGTAARIAWKAADRLIAMILSHFSGGKFLDRRDILDAGVVDENIDTAECLFGLLTIARISSGLVMSAAE